MKELLFHKSQNSTVKCNEGTLFTRANACEWSLYLQNKNHHTVHIPTSIRAHHSLSDRSTYMIDSLFEIWQIHPANWLAPIQRVSFCAFLIPSSQVCTRPAEHQHTTQQEQTSQLPSHAGPDSSLASYLTFGSQIQQQLVSWLTPNPPAECFLSLVPPLSPRSVDLLTPIISLSSPSRFIGVGWHHKQKQHRFQHNIQTSHAQQHTILYLKFGR